MSGPDFESVVEVAAQEQQEVRRDLQQTILSGLALTVPFFVTVLVLLWTLNTLSGALAPLADLLIVLGPAEGENAVVAKAMAAALVFGLILAVGFAAQHGPDTELSKRIDTLMEDLPGIGSIYTSVERMSDVMVSGDTESFQEVKLVEFPREGCYSIAFLTADTPPEIEDAAGEGEMLTVFVPMAPNPVTGGHLLNVPIDRVYDVEMSVEEGMQAVVTTGISIDDGVRDESE